jgi:hypothetical protein
MNFCSTYSVSLTPKSNQARSSKKTVEHTYPSAFIGLTTSLCQSLLLSRLRPNPECPIDHVVKLPMITDIDFALPFAQLPSNKELDSRDRSSDGCITLVSRCNGYKQTKSWDQPAD